jgi:division protein CdvB (Snf7/Vps24/ESCRT-III family)
VKVKHERSETIRQEAVIEKKTKTKQQLLLEMEELQTRLDVTEQRLQEANEILQEALTPTKSAQRRTKIRCNHPSYLSLFSIPYSKTDRAGH